jgi:hypothetical protein
MQYLRSAARNIKAWLLVTALAILVTVGMLAWRRQRSGSATAAGLPTCDCMYVQSKQYGMLAKGRGCDPTVKCVVPVKPRPRIE